MQFTIVSEVPLASSATFCATSVENKGESAITTNPQTNKKTSSAKLELLNKTWKYTGCVQFDFDFIGVQNYFPVVVKHNAFVPYVNAWEVKAASRKVPHTAMGWEISPTGFYNILKRFWKYGGVKEIIVSESGAAFPDKLVDGQVFDIQRAQYHQQYLQALLQAKKEGVRIKGYFAWTLTDNFEWAEGYNARFGLVHVDFKTQLRTVKQSGYWWRDFLPKTYTQP